MPDEKIAELLKAGNIEGLAGHLSGKYGDPGLFTGCMADEDLQGYGEERRARICARAHIIATGRTTSQHQKAATPSDAEVAKVVRREADEWVLYSHDGKKVLGRHKSKAAAQRQEAAIMANKAAGSEALRLFVPIRKIDEEKRLLTGVAAEEVPDKANETFDYETSKPFFEAWSGEFQKATDGKSKGNVRAMHGNIAAGVVKEILFDDGSKTIPVIAHVVDDNEWKKCLAGVYTGFSIGGDYVKRWDDPAAPGRKRYTANPAEISLVDNPCMYGAHFEVVKAAPLAGAPPSVERHVFGERFAKLDLAKAYGVLAAITADPAVRKDAGMASEAAANGIEWLKQAVAEYVLLPGDPDVWTLDDMIYAMTRALSAKHAMDHKAASEAAEMVRGAAAVAAEHMKAAGDGAGATGEQAGKRGPAATAVEVAKATAPVLAAPTAGAGPSSPAVSMLGLSAEDFGKLADAIVGRLLKVEDGKGPVKEEPPAPPAPVVKGQKAEGDGEVEAVRKLLEQIDARLRKVEQTPAAVTGVVRRVQKTLGIGGQETTGDVAPATLTEVVERLEASGQLSGQARTEIRKALAASLMPRL